MYTYLTLYTGELGGISSRSSGLVSDTAQGPLGVFELNNDYYSKDGGIFDPSSHYEEMFKR